MLLAASFLILTQFTASLCCREWLYVIPAH